MPLTDAEVSKLAAGLHQARRTPMQQMLGVDSPDFAPVLSSDLHPDGPSACGVPELVQSV